MFVLRSSSARVPLVALAVVLAAGAVAPVARAQTKVSRGFNLFTKEDDVSIGQKAAVETEKELPILSDAEATALVNDIGQRLAAVAQGPKFTFTFKVVDVSDLNAFALPGGPIYLHRSVIEQARNDGEIAGVLAHEISHVVLRHGTHEMSKAMRAQIFVGLAAGALGGNVEKVVNQFGGFGLQALFLKYSRSAESEADVVGVQTLVKAGYDPADMIGFFDTLAKQDQQRVAEWMSSHPAPEHRIDRIKREAELMKVPVRSGSAPAPSAALARVKERLKRLPPARSLADIKKGGPAGSTGPTGTAGPSGSTGSSGSPGPSSGPVVDRPSSTMRARVTGDGTLRLSAPSNWSVVEDSGSSLTVAPQGGVSGREGAYDVAYGAIVGRYTDGGGSRRTLATATDKLAADMVSSSPYLHVVSGSGRSFRDAGGDGRAVTLAGDNPRTGVREHVELIARPVSSSSIGWLLYVTPQNAPTAYADLLRAMVPTFRVEPGM
jgi:hypothetical protein